MLHTQPVRHYTVPYHVRIAPHGPVLGRVDPVLPSRHLLVQGVQGEMPGGQPTRYSDWGLFQPRVRPLRRLRNLGPPSPTMSPGAYFTPPNLFQIIGIPQASSFIAARLPTRPAAGRTGTPPVRHFAINPFPGARLPTPTYPPPAAFRGSF